MVNLRKSGFVRFFIDTPKKQLQRKQLITKLIITLAVFCIVFIPSIVVYMKIYNSWCIEKNTIWYHNNLFKIDPGWNDIKSTYQLWWKLSIKNKNWLTLVQILVAFAGIGMLGLCFFFINNKIVYTCSMFAYFGIMFNWIDASIGGMALDYIMINSKFEWLHQMFLWPGYLPILIVNKTSNPPFAQFNLPDVFLSIGVIGMISGFVVLAWIKIGEQIKKIDQGIYLYHLKK